MPSVYVRVFIRSTDWLSSNSASLFPLRWKFDVCAAFATRWLRNLVTVHNRMIEEFGLDEKTV